MPEQLNFGGFVREMTQRSIKKLEQRKINVMARMAKRATLDSPEQRLWAAVVKQAIEELLWDNRRITAPQSAGEFLRSQNFEGIAMEIGLRGRDVRRWLWMEGILL